MRTLPSTSRPAADDYTSGTDQSVLDFIISIGVMFAAVGVGAASLFWLMNVLLEASAFAFPYYLPR